MLTKEQLVLIRRWLKHAGHYKFFGKKACRRQLAIFGITSEIDCGYLRFLNQAIHLQRHPWLKKRGLWTGRLVMHLALCAGLLSEPVFLVNPDDSATMHFCKKLLFNIDIAKKE